MGSMGFVSRMASIAVLAVALPLHAQTAELSCEVANGATFPVTGVANTNGFGPFTAGDRISITIAADGGTATTATWNLVGSPFGVPVYAGPAGLGATLSYTIPVTGLAAGYYVTAIDGTATATFACIPAPPVAVPALSPLATAGLAALVGLLGLAGLGLARRRS